MSDLSGTMQRQRQHAKLMALRALLFRLRQRLQLRGMTAWHLFHHNSDKSASQSQMREWEVKDAVRGVSVAVAVEGNHCFVGDATVIISVAIGSSQWSFLTSLLTIVQTKAGRIASLEAELKALRSAPGPMLRVGTSVATRRSRWRLLSVL
jgi:hypothetical protein